MAGQVKKSQHDFKLMLLAVAVAIAWWFVVTGGKSL